MRRVVSVLLLGVLLAGCARPATDTPPAEVPHETQTFMAEVSGVRVGPDELTVLVDLNLPAGKDGCARDPKATNLTEEGDLDGVIENPMWTTPYFDDEANAFAGQQTDAADAMLMGRVTYDGMSVAWPQSDDTDPTTGAAYFNSVKKYVASTTLTDPTWNNTEVLQGDLIDAVTKLKAQDGKDILQYGYGSVTAQLVAAGLVDEVRFWICPVLEGGDSVTTPLKEFKTSFELIDTKVMKSGVIIASYRPKAA